jgi:hypothetical protein
MTAIKTEGPQRFCSPSYQIMSQIDHRNRRRRSKNWRVYWLAPRHSSPNNYRQALRRVPSEVPALISQWTELHLPAALADFGTQASKGFLEESGSSTPWTQEEDEWLLRDSLTIRPRWRYLSKLWEDPVKWNWRINGIRCFGTGTLKATANLLMFLTKAIEDCLFRESPCFRVKWPGNWMKRENNMKIRHVIDRRVKKFVSSVFSLNFQTFSFVLHLLMEVFPFVFYHPLEPVDPYFVQLYRFLVRFRRKCGRPRFVSSIDQGAYSVSFRLV